MKRNEPLQALTKAEEEVMQIIWTLDRCLVKDIIEQLGDPDIPHSTVSSVVRILEKKGFVDHKAYGNSHVYFPVISEDNYKKFAFDKIMNNYFSNSYQSLVSFLVNEKNMSVNELEELTKLAQNLKNKKP